MSLTVTAPPVEFKRYQNVPPTKINLTVDAVQKSGKSHFALTAPGPIAYHDFDRGLGGVADKFPDKEIYHFNYVYSATNKLPGSDQAPLAEKAAKVWSEFVRNVLASAESHRSVVIDPGHRVWDLIRLARLGKLTQVPPLQYVAVNAEFTELIQKLHGSPANILWLHRMKPVYVNNEKTNAFERSGYSDIGYDVDTALRTTYDANEGWTVTLDSCRTDKTLEGGKLSGENATFQGVAKTMYPNADENNWR
jgi:hypothetical protein